MSVFFGPIAVQRFHEILDYVRSVGEPVTRLQVARHFGVNKVTAARYLDMLVFMGHIRSEQRTYSYLPITVYWVEQS